MKIIIAILVAVSIINSVIAYACCVVAGRADDVVEEVWRDYNNTL